ncbi:MAG: AhpC/TSA family protein [Solirubrobacterales bacterium]
MQLHREREALEETGAGLVLIGQATPRHAAHFRRRQDIDLPVLADEKRESYKAAGAKVATLSELLGPKVAAKGLVSSLRSRQPQGRTIGHPAQLGGTMIVRPDGSVPWSHMSEDASDNASPAEILAAIREA